MKSDRELLELAAQAAGLEFDPTYKNAHGLKIVRDGAVCQSDQILWNPIIDDNDALRLAVKLRMDVEWLDADTVFVSGGPCIHVGVDHYAATRRAIVRAAAEIGKGLE